MKEIYRVVFCRHMLLLVMGVMMAFSIYQSILPQERLPIMDVVETHALSLHDTLFYSLLDPCKPYPSCPRQMSCSEMEYNDYLQFVPLYYRVCGECTLELELRHSQGLPFMYHTIEDMKYPTIAFGSGLQYLCYPEFSSREQYFLLILILSSATEIEERAALRSYYNRMHVNSIRFIFVTASNPEVNEAVANESRQFHDIIQLNHIDSYHNLTLSVFGALQLLSQDTSYAQYIMKTDSDCVLNLPRIEAKLQQYAGFQYAGNCRINVGYYTANSRRKNYVPKELVGEGRIEQYATGAGYVIASSVLPKLVVAFRHLPYLTHNEDVNVGRAMSLIHVKCRMFWKWIARNGCSKSSCKVYSIIHSPDNWRKVFDVLFES